MAVRIRLTRTGAKKRPFYRLVVADSRSPRDGRFIEILGHYNPITEPSVVKVDEERAVYWLLNGASLQTLRGHFSRRQASWRSMRRLEGPGPSRPTRLFH